MQNNDQGNRFSVYFFISVTDGRLNALRHSLIIYSSFQLLSLHGASSNWKCDFAAWSESCRREVSSDTRSRELHTMWWSDRTWRWRIVALKESAIRSKIRVCTGRSLAQSYSSRRLYPCWRGWTARRYVSTWHMSIRTICNNRLCSRACTARIYKVIWINWITYRCRTACVRYSSNIIDIPNWIYSYS